MQRLRLQRTSESFRPRPVESRPAPTRLSDQMRRRLAPAAGHPVSPGCSESDRRARYQQDGPVTRYPDARHPVGIVQGRKPPPDTSAGLYESRT